MIGFGRRRSHRDHYRLRGVQSLRLRRVPVVAWLQDCDARKVGSKLGPTADACVSPVLKDCRLASKTRLLASNTTALLDLYLGIQQGSSARLIPSPMIR